jgi:lactose/L-arabinose transport system substrate-binding protein
MKKKWIALLLTAMMVVGTLAGCTGGSGDGDKKDDRAKVENGAGSESGDNAGTGVQKMTVWCWDPTFNINAMNAAAEIYKKDYPEFELEVTEISAGDIIQKLATSTSAGNTADVLPDVILFDDSLVAQEVVSYPDVFMDLTDAGIDFSQFSEGKVACSVVDGKNYGIPFDSGAAIAAYRTDVLKEAGYTIDDFTDITWSEWIKKAKVVKEKTGKALINGQSSYNQVTVMLKSCGGSYFDEDGNIDIAGNKKIKRVCELYLEMLEAGVYQEEVGWDTYIGNINNGNVAGAMNGCWIMSSIQAAADQSGLWAITNVPSVDGVDDATNYSSQGGSTWTITNECKNVDLVIDFFNSTFAGSKELYDTILPTCAIATWIPAGESEAYTQEVEFYGNQQVYSTIVDYTAKIPISVINAYDASARTAVCTAITNVAFSGADLDEELKAAEETVSFEMGQ